MIVQQTALFAGIPSSTNIVATFTVMGEPASKARPRFDHRGSKSHAYTPSKTKAAEARVAQEFLKVAKKKGTDSEKTYGISAHFYNGTRQRRDVDNMLKLILDGLNGWAFPDDSQVVEVIGRKSIVPKSEARTEVTLYKIGEVDRLTKPCAHCGNNFITWPSLYEATKYCSQECNYEHRKELKTVTCIQCGNTFQAHGKEEAKSRKFCSKECRKQWSGYEVACSICGKKFWRTKRYIKKRNYCSRDCMLKNEALKAKDRRKHHMPGTCLICGGGTSRKEYKRCNTCRLEGKHVANE